MTFKEKVAQIRNSEDILKKYLIANPAIAALIGIEDFIASTVIAILALLLNNMFVLFLYPFLCLLLVTFWIGKMK